jgi:hypothetical protein
MISEIDLISPEKEAEFTKRLALVDLSFNRLKEALIICAREFHEIGINTSLSDFIRLQNEVFETCQNFQKYERPWKTEKAVKARSKIQSKIWNSALRKKAESCAGMNKLGPLFKKWR